jgi:hypothetical protein
MRIAVRVSIYLLSTVLGFGNFCAFAQAPIRVAIVGLEHGHISGFLKQFPKQHEVELVGIVDTDAALTHRYAQEFHLDPSLFYTQLDAMVAARHPQALLVYTSIGKHREVIEAAAQRGLSVMVEKPLTMSLDDALAIRRAAREHHIQVLVNYETTWYASNKAAYDEVAKGSLGDLRRIVVHDGHEGPKEIGVPPEFLKWLEDPEQNGDGALYDFGCYGADLVTWLMHGERDTGVLDLHDHVVAVEGGRTMDLADRGRGKRARVEVREHALQRPAELPPHEFLEVCERHRRDVVAKLGELALQFVLLVLGEAVEVDHRHHLANLHRRSAHLPKLVDELIDERGRPVALGGGGALGRPDPVDGPHTRPPQALPGHQPPDPRRPREPTGGQPAGLPRRIVVRRTHRPRLAGRLDRPESAPLPHSPPNQQH